jgi:hypothetical protein
LGGPSRDEWPLTVDYVLAMVVPRPTWMKDGLCKQYPHPALGASQGVLPVLGAGGVPRLRPGSPDLSGI